MLILALIFSFSAFLGSLLALFPLKGLLVHWQIIDLPNSRSSHTQPKPRGGGVVIVISTLIGIWLIYPAMLASIACWRLILFTLVALLIAGVSWLDDVRSLPFWLRLTVHCLGATISILTLGYVQGVTLPLLGRISLGWLGVPLTFVWIVGLINGYNFMDGIDGLAGSQAIIAGIGWALLGWLGGQPLVGTLGLLLAASSAGFLWHNWPPASIFLGDVGSAFLGYTFAVLPLFYNIDHQNGALCLDRTFIAAVLFLWPFIWDATFTFCRRVFKHENVLTAHRSHLYQRLVISGCSHRVVTCIYIGLALIGVIFALIWVFGFEKGLMLLPLLVLLPAVTLWFLVILQERKRNRPLS
ncbi:MAG: glycosyltransferase family 4 protein [Armatimonadota bacterium]